MDGDISTNHWQSSSRYMRRDNINSRIDKLRDEISSIKGEELYKKDIRLPNVEQLKPELAEVWAELTIARAIIQEYERRAYKFHKGRN